MNEERGTVGSSGTEACRRYRECPICFQNEG